jgi:hypothetical protein
MRGNKSTYDINKSKLVTFGQNLMLFYCKIKESA